MVPQHRSLFTMLATLLFLSLAFLQATPVSAASVVPVVRDGNPACQDLGYAYGFKIDAWDKVLTFPVTDKKFPFVNALNVNGGFNTVLTGGTPPDAANSVTINSGDGVYFNWSATLGIDVVIVKGGSNANIYTYPSKTSSDTGLHAPLNPKNGQPSAISHVEFCYDYELGVTKDAAGTYDRTITWTLDKSVSLDTHTGFAGNSFESTWTVEATKTEVKDNYKVTGDIRITNPSPAPVSFSVTDLIDGSITATVSCPANTVAAFSTITCPYEAVTGIDGAQTTNVATVTSSTPGVSGGSATASIIFTAHVIGDESVTVNDSRTGGPDGNAISATEKWTYKETFTCSTKEGDYTAGIDSDGYLNIATAQGSNTNLEAQAEVKLTCYAPVVTKTATAGYDETHIWDISKSVTPESQSGFPSDKLSWTWQVDVSERSVDGNFAVNGTISVKNPHPNAPMTVNVADALNDGAIATVDCDSLTDGNQSSLTVAAGQTGDCSYSASPNNAAATLNTATATLNGIGFTGTAAVNFVKNVIGGTATVIDDQISLNESLTAGAGPWSFTKEEEHTCSTDSNAYGANGSYAGNETNTATVTASNNQTDSADAATTYTCYAPTISTTADPHYTRDWTWSVTKAEKDNITTLLLSAGQQHQLNYQVTLNATGTEEFAVFGTITVKNPHPDALMTVALADSVNGTPATIGPCSDGIYANGNLTIDQGATAVCEYIAILNTPTGGTNTATATIGGADFKATAAYTFGSPTLETDECIEVTDDKEGVVRTVCAGDAPKTFAYSLLVGPYTCGDQDIKHEFVNTATFTTNDTSATGSDSWTVTVTVPSCQKGCTLTQGYWKTHSNKGPAPYDDTWAKIGESTTFFLSGKSYYDVLWTAPAGNSYYNLAHQYIAAYLNQLNGANFTAAQSAFDAATTLLKKYTPAQVAAMKANDPVRKQFISLAATLDQYNNGLIGPGHCSEGTGVGGVGFDEAIQRVFLPTIRNQ